MTQADLIWAGLILAGAAFEALALANKRSSDTLSEVTRAVFRINTSKSGRIAFGSLWAGFAVWFWGHILYGWPFPLT